MPEPRERLSELRERTDSYPEERLRDEELRVVALRDVALRERLLFTDSRVRS